MESIESAGLLAKKDQPQQTMSMTPIPAIDCILIINLPFQVFFCYNKKNYQFLYLLHVSHTLVI